MQFIVNNFDVLQLVFRRLRDQATTRWSKAEYALKPAGSQRWS